MKKCYIIIWLFFLSCHVLFGQNFYNDLIKSEKQKAQNLRKISEVQYPGDSTIDVTYYKLDLNITYTPQYLNGIVTVNFKSVSNSLTTFFLDLQNSMSVDSVTMNGSAISFFHPLNIPKLYITLPSPFARKNQNPSPERLW